MQPKLKSKPKPKLKSKSKSKSQPKSNPTKTWQDSAPSNIALIKYMGKTDSKLNKPSNSSLSYTVEHLRSFVRLEMHKRPSKDVWAPEEVSDKQVGKLKGKQKLSHKLQLSQEGQTRFLNHLAMLKQKWKVSETFTVYSANNFPSDCGLASSASSFAALTKVAVRALNEITLGETKGKKLIDTAKMTAKMAALSQLGSGSSCRSFYSPWALWSEDGVSPVDLPGFANLTHFVVVVEDQKKKVSSSQAHRQVPTSLLFSGRCERANQRIVDFTQALKHNRWSKAFEIAWAEMWDMHALFETSNPPFGYMTEKSLAVLRIVQNHWEKTGQGPLVTMDAGANIHLLFVANDPGLISRLQKDFRVMGGNV